MEKIRRYGARLGIASLAVALTCLAPLNKNSAQTNSSNFSNSPVQVENKETLDSIMADLVLRARKDTSFVKMRDAPSVERYSFVYDGDQLDIAFKRDRPYFLSYSGKVDLTNGEYRVRVIDFFDKAGIETYLEDADLKGVKTGQDVKTHMTVQQQNINFFNILKRMRSKL